MRKSTFISIKFLTGTFLVLTLNFLFRLNLNAGSRCVSPSSEKSGFTTVFRSNQLPLDSENQDKGKKKKKKKKKKSSTTSSTKDHDPRGGREAPASSDGGSDSGRNPAGGSDGRR